MSDLFAMGDMISLLDHLSIGSINKESMRRVAPHLIKNSCFQTVYESFPGHIGQPTFEEVNNFYVINYRTITSVRHG